MSRKIEDSIMISFSRLMIYLGIHQWNYYLRIAFNDNHLNIHLNHQSNCFQHIQTISYQNMVVPNFFLFCRNDSSMILSHHIYHIEADLMEASTLIFTNLQEAASMSN